MMAIIETVPEMDLTSTEIDDLVEELKDYHRIYGPLFVRSEPRQWSEKYLHGLLLDIPRKSIEPMVLALEGANPNAVRAMQHFISEGHGTTPPSSTSTGRKSTWTWGTPVAY